MKSLLSPEMQREMDEFREEERATRAALRAESKKSTSKEHSTGRRKETSRLIRRRPKSKLL